MGLKPDDNIGNKIRVIKGNYNKSQKGEKTNGIAPTEAQVKRLKEMGVWEKNTIDEAIEKLEKLQEIGVDVSRIVQTDTILKLVGKTLDEPEEILIQRIKEMGLEADDNIGRKISQIKTHYNKSQKGEKAKGITPTEAQVKRLKEMGVWEKNTIDEAIEKLEKLQEIGVDVSKIAIGNTTILELVGKTLDEPEEILIQRIKEMGLKPDDNIGNKIRVIKGNYNKSQKGEKTNGIAPTEAQVKRLKEMGVWEKNTIDEAIEKLEKLQEIGVDVSKIQLRETVLTLARKTLKEPEEILMQKIKEMGLKPDYDIGKRISKIKTYYNKSQRGEDTDGVTIATEAQVEKIRSFGIKIGKEITGQSIGQASYTATTRECDEAQANLDRLIQEERTKEGEREQND